MKAMVTGLVGVAALGLAGCATLNSPEAFQNAAAQKQDCRMVALANDYESVRLAAKPGVDGDAMEKTEGALKSGQVVLHAPPGTATTGPVLERNTSKLQRDC
jgi:uncharacterized membrane protein